MTHAVRSFMGGEFRSWDVCTSVNSVPFILLQAEMPPNLKSQAEYIFMFLSVLILSQQCFLLLFL